MIFMGCHSADPRWRIASSTMAPVKKPARTRKAHFFAKWREAAGLTQEQAMQQLGWSQSKMSRIENLVTPFNQDDLEAAAELYGCNPAALLLVDPTDAQSSWRYLLAAGEAAKAKREQIVSYAKFTLGD